MPDAFICDFIRTPIGRYAGALAAIRADDLAALPVAELLRRNPALAPESIDEVLLGCANQAGEDNRNVARMAVLLAGLPETVPGATINRLCGSGMDAVGSAARAVRSAELELVIAGGVESMSRAPLVMPKAERAFSRQAEIYDTTIGWRFVNPRMAKAFGTDSMPETAATLAREHGISREDQDRFALRSQLRVAAARERDFFREELMTITIRDSRGRESRISEDEHPRGDTDADSLARLAPIVPGDRSITAGNSAGINDGACALLIASDTAIARHGLTPVARIVAMATSGVAPRVMGIGPVSASKRALALAGLTIEQMDVIELNEAFAAQALAVLRELGVADDASQVNPNGGAIALGHPLGMSGARLVGTAARQLSRAGGRFALCTMCIGVGQGIAVILEAAR